MQKGSQSKNIRCTRLKSNERKEKYYAHITYDLDPPGTELSWNEAYYIGSCRWD